MKQLQPQKRFIVSAGQKKRKIAAFAKAHTSDDASPRQQRSDMWGVAGGESSATHANDQRTANCVTNTSVLSDRLESVCEETAPT